MSERVRISPLQTSAQTTIVSELLPSYGNTAEGLFPKGFEGGGQGEGCILQYWKVEDLLECAHGKVTKRLADRKINSAWVRSSTKSGAPSLSFGLLPIMPYQEDPASTIAQATASRRKNDQQ